MIGGVLAVFGHISVGGLVVFLQLTRQFSRPITEASSPVSYTHLDVYKRQAGHSAGGQTGAGAYSGASQFSDIRRMINVGRLEMCIRDSVRS